MPRSIFGKVNTNWRWGTSWQTEAAVQAPVWRVRRWWQAGQKWRDLQVKARSFSWPQSGLWIVMEPERLTARAKSPITIPSAISAFDIAVIARKNKLDLKLPADEWWRTALTHHGIASIPVSAEIALASVALPPHRNDPADRIIIATAELLTAPGITSDAAFRAYGSIIVEW
jgi:PIN domain nuclease of toxin-antitoxin system